MAVKTLANIRDELSITTGDYLHSTVTTAIAASTNIVDTALANVEGGGTDNFWQDWWVLITSHLNIGVVRKISTYTASTQTIVVLGGVLLSDTANLATYEIHRNHPTTKKDAINISARKLYSRLYRKITDLSVVTGDILPDFNWWTSASVHKFWLTNNTTIARTSPSATTGLSRDQRYSMKSTVSSAAGYVYINNKIYPRLLDLQGHTISIYVQVYPEDNGDVFIDLYTKTIAGTAATTSSTTTTYLGKWQPIKLENHSVPDNLEQIELRVRGQVINQYAYISEPRIVGRGIYDYMLPELFQNGEITWVRRQTTGYDNFKPADGIGYDDSYVDVFGWNTVTEDVNGTNYKFLRTPNRISANYKLELQGFAPLEDNLSADTDTITIDDPWTQLLVLESAKQMYKMLRGQGSSMTSDTYETEVARLDLEIARLGNLRMGQPANMLRVRR
uniref:Uncharacterized protein n=1 Tax=viral metagenome TaxID=1070528 RepID=A0A6H1ZDK1_9ZZZZ